MTPCNLHVWFVVNAISGKQHETEGVSCLAQHYGFTDLAALLARIIHDLGLFLARN